MKNGMKVPRGRTLVAWLLGGELVLVGSYYLLSPQGIRSEYAYAARAHLLTTEIDELQSTIAALERKINDWHRSSWYREKAAREQLGMCYPDEEIFLLPKNG